jgi:aminopeptidase N
VRRWQGSETKRARRYRRLGYFLCVLCFLYGASGLGSEAVRAQTPAVEPLRTAADRPFDIQHIRLDLRVDLPIKAAQGRATIQLRSLRPISAISLDAVDFEVSQVTLRCGDPKDQPVRFSHDGRKLVLDLEPSWPAGKEATLRIDYRVREPKAGLHFFGPTEAEPDVPLTVWSQGEPDTNRYWFPCVDQPNQRQTTELVVTVADGFEVLSNGKLIEQHSNPDKTVTFHWRQDKPHPAYLVTLVVGQFDIVREEWNQLPVLFYVPKGHRDDVARTFGRTREMLTFFSERFGIDYPWEKYAQVVVEQFAAGGMENTSATTLTDRALHDQRSTLDSSAEGLLAHELAHQWWGDLVTCRDWSHLWLNEGFASYAEVLWARHAKGSDEARYQLVQKARGAIAGGKERPIVDRRYPSSWSMFDARSYPKGAWVLHMLRQRLGEEMFWKCIQQYGTEHRLQSADTTDFRKTLERVTGRSLERFFYDWTERPGHPVLDITTDYLVDSKQVRIVVKQTQAGEAFQFPLQIVINRHVIRTVGSTLRGAHVELEITEKEQTVYFRTDRPELVEIDPMQSVLAEIKETKSRELWQKQLTYSPSVAVRIRAAEHFGQSKAPADREALAAALHAETFWGVQAEIAAALGESGGDTCRDALVRGLQHAHPKVRRACAEQLGKFHRDARAAAALKAVLQKGDPSYFVEAASLGAYAKLQQPDTVAVLLPWLAKPSHNDILRAAALEGLGNSQDLSALDTLTTWTKRGKPRACRAAALLGLARLALKANPSDEQRQRVVTVVAACLDSETAPIRRSAVTALRELGRSAAPTLETLDAIARHDPDERLRELARKAAEQIRSNTPVPVELTRLREELERVKRANEALRERVDKFEKIERK